jgi:two-component system OmpR family response regulator
MGKYKILVVDDEVKILDLVKNYLEKEGFSVIAAENGKKALKLFEEEKPDLVVLDLMMPEMNGYEVCKKICAASQTPVIMLTARSEEVDKLLGLELGADDYITKPFSLRELAARIRVVLRRIERSLDGKVPENGRDGILEYEGIKMDQMKKSVTLNGKNVSLTPTEYKILALLLSNPGVVFSRLQILEEVLGDYYEGYERSLDTHMSNLRKKLGDDPANPHYIKTVYGMGYKLGG